MVNSIQRKLEEYKYRMFFWDAWLLDALAYLIVYGTIALFSGIFNIIFYPQDYLIFLFELEQNDPVIVSTVLTYEQTLQEIQYYVKKGGFVDKYPYIDSDEHMNQLLKMVRVLIKRSYQNPDEMKYLGHYVNLENYLKLRVGRLENRWFFF